MTKNEDLYQKALDAINKLYTDVSVSKGKAIANLNALMDEIDIMIEALET